MQPHDLDLVPRGEIADALPLRRRDVRDRVSEREWRDLDSGITHTRRVRERVFQLPVFINLVADGEFHARRFRVSECEFKIQSHCAESDVIYYPKQFNGVHQLRCLISLRLRSLASLR